MLLAPELLERIAGLSLVARRVVEGVMHGLHRSPLHGLSIEFAQHRQYTPGDELKHLDWLVLARQDRYVIKQYEQETNLRAVLAVDCSASMAYSGENPDATSDGPMPKFELARILAAALGYLMLHQGDSVGLVLAGDSIVRQVAPRAAPGHLMSLCHALESTTPTGGTQLASVLNQLAGSLRRRSLIVVISDLLDDPETVLAALGQLHHRGHEVVVFHVLDPREISFDLGHAGHGVTVIRDMETGSEFDAEPLLIRDLVRLEVKRFLEALDEGARHHGLHLVRCLTDEPAAQVLTRYLSGREARRR